MKRSSLLTGLHSLGNEFARCCAKYNSLSLAVAWCGNPNQVLPYTHLENFTGQITATIGTSFNQTHPDAIEWFKRIGANVRIFRHEGELFHPKVYLFTKGNRYALFVGSSNLTYGGFHVNVEVNSLTEGILFGSTSGDVQQLQSLLDDWQSTRFSSEPTGEWLDQYRAEYAKTARLLRIQNITIAPNVEEDLGTATWLRSADWTIYYQKIADGLSQRKRSAEGYHKVLDDANRLVPRPWRVSYFADLEKRRMIGGIGEYGWLGHVGASGRFRKLLARGSHEDLAKIVRCINAVASITHPIGWRELESTLTELVRLGPSMKVWGRLLCILRPDLYCTVASPSVRINLAATLAMPVTMFETPEGYVRLLQLIHSSPWFNSKKPFGEREAAVWERRVAFMDAIFYE